MSRITIYDVAANSGLSIATVSKYMNNKGNIREENRIKIQNAMRTLGYTPSETARHLATSKSKIIGILFDSALSGRGMYSSEIIQGVFKEADNRGYSVLLKAPSGDSREYARNLAASNSVAGVVMPIAFDDDFIHAFLDNGLKVSYIGSRKEWDTEGLNVYGGMWDYNRDVITGLYHMGCRRILFIEQNQNRPSKWQKTVEGYGLDGLESEYLYFLTGRSDYDALRKKLQRVMHSKRRPDAIYFMDSNIQLLIYTIVESCGLKVGKDIRLVTTVHSDLQVRALPQDMGIVCVDAYTMGQRAAELLIDRIEDEEVPGGEEFHNVPYRYWLR